MALRDGFCRYAFSIQYRASQYLLGCTYLGSNENNILKDGTDLRGYRTVESRLRQAFGDMVGPDNYEKIRFSSRTDRGVHALKNTCQVDIKLRPNGDAWEPDTLHGGVNHFLAHEGTRRDGEFSTRKRDRRKSIHSPLMNDLRLLKVKKAPLTMVNTFYSPENGQPKHIHWNVRFSATQRTYIYRILTCNHGSSSLDWALPFEWDRSWRLIPSINNKKSNKEALTNYQQTGRLDVDAMKQAADYLIGTHDFSSFRSVGCERKSPNTTVKDIQIVSQPYGPPLYWNASGGLLGIGDSAVATTDHNNLVTIQVVGTSFVYRQVRNIVGALVAVGQGKVPPINLKTILDGKDRTRAPAMAPSNGLYLVDVQHGDFVL